MVKNRQDTKPAPVQEIRFAHPEGSSVHVQTVRVSELRERRMSHSIYEPMRLDFHVLQLVIEGRGRHSVDFERLALRRGDLLHIRPGQVHAFDAGSTHDALMVVFLPEALPHAFPLELTRPHRTAAIRPAAEDFSLLVDLAQLLEDLPERGERIRAQELGPALLGALVSATEHLVNVEHALGEAGSPGSDRLVRSFETLLEERHVTQRGVAWYAARLGVSTRTLARACDAALGTKPKRHIDARLVLEAKRRLIFSSASVEDLSLELGFSEPTNFVKFFRRLAAQTPQEFRRRIGAAPGSARPIDDPDG